MAKEAEKPSGRLNFGKLISWAAFIIYLGLVTYLCFGNVENDAKTISKLLPEEILGIATDKCIHFIMFFPFVILAFLAFKKDERWRTLTLAILTAVSMAFCFEFLQSVLTDYRSSDPWDFVANMTAITSSSIIMAISCIIGELRRR